MFNEPEFPRNGCVVCRDSCKIPNFQNTLLDIKSAGIIMHDNVAHSNTDSGIWVNIIIIIYYEKFDYFNLFFFF